MRGFIKKTWRLRCFIILITAMLITASAVADIYQTALQGKKFSDPGLVSHVPEGWLEKPVKYEKWAEGADLAVALDQHSYQLFLPAVKKYAKKHKLNIKVRESTCGASSGMLFRKEVDIGGFCCPAGLNDRMPQLQFHSYGITGLTVLVHPDNPVDNITFDQARKIFQGKIRKWSELKSPDGSPGPDTLIQLFARLHCKLRPGHWCSLLGHEDNFGHMTYELGSIRDVIEKAAVNKRAIAGFESFYMAYYRYRQDRSPKFLTIDGYSPDVLKDLVSGSYPMYFVFNLTTWKGREVENPHAKDLLEFLIKQAELLDPKYNIVPVSSLKKAGWKFNGDELVGEPQ